jgi:hypothetical protein
MNYLTKKTLDKYKEHWISLRDAGFIKNLNQVTINELEAIYKQEVDANFFVNKWCMSCVAEMVQRLFLSLDYDNYKEPIKEFADTVKANELNEMIQATFINNFDSQNVNKTVPKKRGRKSKK